MTSVRNLIVGGVVFCAISGFISMTSFPHEVLVEVGPPSGDRWQEAIPKRFRTAKEGTTTLPGFSRNPIATTTGGELANPIVAFHYRQQNFPLPATWTSDGQWVFTNGTVYHPVREGADVATVAEITGIAPDRLTTPGLYRYPFGLLLGVGFATFVAGLMFVIRRAQAASRTREVSAAAQDPRYADALRLAAGPGGINAGVDFLVDAGVPVRDAHRNLTALMGRR